MSTTLSTANAQVNPPDATTLADDLVAGVHFPIVKLDSGAAGISAPERDTNDELASGVGTAGIISLLKGIYANTLGSVDGGFASSVATGGIDGGFA